MAAPRVALAGQAIPAYARTAGRAVHVKIHPRPRNLGESREVLRVLQQYGDVTMYKHLKHEPDLHAANTALAIYQNTESAEKIINASPLRFELGKAERNSSLSQYIDTKAAEEAQQKEDGAVEAAIISEREQSIQEPEDEAQPEFAEVRRSRRQNGERASSAEDDFAAFKGLQGTTPNASDTLQATTMTTASPRTPKPFTPNPAPSSTSPAELPFTSLPSSTEPSLKEFTREFHLTITRSVMNHHAYIQRQHYYGPFHLDWRSLMADDLKGRVPVAGFRDLRLGKGESPLRDRLKRREEEGNGEGRVTLRQMWEVGQRKREKSAEINL
ncbi:hypothetical protein N7G274_005371 [Stereocaulon virgatum]|uniref:Uncharacterized protein n=1 Tax=Stereocaulon virgatum TaxID=373712 RepID=A0ABR4AAV0_9LECA